MGSATRKAKNTFVSHTNPVVQFRSSQLLPQIFFPMGKKVGRCTLRYVLQILNRPLTAISFVSGYKGTALYREAHSSCSKDKTQNGLLAFGLTSKVCVGMNLCAPRCTVFALPLFNARLPSQRLHEFSRSNSKIQTLLCPTPNLRHKIYANRTFSSSPLGYLALCMR